MRVSGSGASIEWSCLDALSRFSEADFRMMSSRF
jgi:hypothetical protein